MKVSAGLRQPNPPNLDHKPLENKTLPRNANHWKETKARKNERVEKVPLQVAVLGLN